MHLLLFVLPAMAGDSLEDPREGMLSLGLRASAEALQDENINRAYQDLSPGTVSTEDTTTTDVRDLRFGAEVTLGMPIQGPFELELSAGYKKLNGKLVTESGVKNDVDSWFWYAPLSAVVLYEVPVEPIELRVGAGPSWTLWSEQQVQKEEDIGHQGAKPGALVMGEARFPTPWVRPPLHTSSASVQRLDLVLTTGYRWSYQTRNDCEGESPCGLNFSAFRVGAGVAVRF